MEYMRVTPGITEPNITDEPLGTEGEMTPGPADINPYRSAEERRIVEQIEAQRRGQPPADDVLDTVGAEPVGPMADPEPFVFDDVPGAVDDVQLPTLEREQPSLFQW